MSHNQRGDGDRPVGSVERGRLRLYFRARVASVAGTFVFLVSTLALELRVLPGPGSPARDYEGLVAPMVALNALTLCALAGLVATCYFTVGEIRVLRSMGRLRMDYLVASIGLVAGVCLLFAFLGFL